jgi:hypothetical protein
VEGSARSLEETEKLRMRSRSMERDKEKIAQGQG